MQQAESSRDTVFTNKLPSAVTLGGAYDGSEASPVGSRESLQSAVGYQQQQQQRRLFVRKVEVAA